MWVNGMQSVTSCIVTEYSTQIGMCRVSNKTWNMCVFRYSNSTGHMNPIKMNLSKFWRKTNRIQIKLKSDDSDNKCWISAFSSETGDNTWEFMSCKVISSSHFHSQKGFRHSWMGKHAEKATEFCFRSNSACISGHVFFALIIYICRWCHTSALDETKTLEWNMWKSI